MPSRIWITDYIRSLIYYIIIWIVKVFNFEWMEKIFLLSMNSWQKYLNIHDKNIRRILIVLSTTRKIKYFSKSIYYEKVCNFILKQSMYFLKICSKYRIYIHFEVMYYFDGHNRVYNGKRIVIKIYFSFDGQNIFTFLLPASFYIIRHSWN